MICYRDSLLASQSFSLLSFLLRLQGQALVWSSQLKRRGESFLFWIFLKLVCLYPPTARNGLLFVRCAQKSEQLLENANWNVLMFGNAGVDCPGAQMWQPPD